MEDFGFGGILVFESSGFRGFEGCGMQGRKFVGRFQGLRLRSVGLGVYSAFKV